MDLKRIFRSWMLVILLVFVLLVVVLKFTGSNQYHEVNTSQVMKLVQTGQVKSAILNVPTQVVQVTTKNGRNLEATWVGNQQNQIAGTLQHDNNIGKLPGGYDVKNPQGNSLLNVLLGWLPFIVIFLLFFVFMNQMQGGGSRVMNFGKSRAKLITKDTPKTTFADVAGADEAIEELEEIKEFLQTPAKFQAIGAKIPKGVLLYGPPGTGKTLLARAVAGFDTKGGVIVIAATNRPDILDPALLRPGRFDRQIVVAQPDLAGRKGILKVHARGKPIAPDADLDIIARRTPGFTGADLANVINEGALLTARHNGKQITMDALEEAIDRVMAGPERKSVLLSERERKVIAYHEYGMSERLGARKFGNGDGEPFLGRDMSHSRDYSDEIASSIDEEIHRLIESAHDEAWEVLVQYRDVLDALVLRLLDKETVARTEVLEIFATVEKRPVRGSYTGHGKRLPSDRPPVLSPKELALAAADGGAGNGNMALPANGQSFGFTPSNTEPSDSE